MLFKYNLLLEHSVSHTFVSGYNKVLGFLVNVVKLSRNNFFEDYSKARLHLNITKTPKQKVKSDRIIASEKTRTSSYYVLFFIDNTKSLQQKKNNYN